LSIVNYPLSTIHHPPSTIHRPLSTIHCPLSIVNYPLSTVNCQSTLHFSGSIPRRASKNLSFPSTPSGGPCAGRDADPNPPYRITLPSSIFQLPSGRIFRSNDSAIAGSSGRGNPLLSIADTLPNRHGKKNTAPDGLAPGGIRRPAIPPERGTNAGAGRCTTSRRGPDCRSAAINRDPGSDS